MLGDVFRGFKRLVWFVIRVIVTKLRWLDSRLVGAAKRPSENEKNTLKGTPPPVKVENFLNIKINKFLY